MRTTILLAALAAFCLAHPAFATPSNSNNSDTTATSTAKSDASAAALGVGVGIGVGHGGDASAGALAINGPNTNVNGNANTNTALGGAATANGGRSDANASASLGNLNSFGGDATAGVVGSGNSSNTNLNLDVNRVTGINGQQQGQTANGGSASSDQDQRQQQGQDQSQTATSDQRQQQGIDSVIGAVGSGNRTDVGGQTANHSSSTEVNVEGDTVTYEAQRRSPVSSAYAAPLSIGGGVCAYTPVSGAGQFVSFGLSGSAAKIDEGCERRATADVFARIGMTYEACQIMASAKYAVAAGIVCTRPVVAVVVPPASQPTTHAPVTMVPVPNPVPVNDGERG